MALPRPGVLGKSMGSSGCPAADRSSELDGLLRIEDTQAVEMSLELDTPVLCAGSCTSGGTGEGEVLGVITHLK